jgi:hypothetical protein
MMVEISCFQALAVTITKTVTEPMELVSKGMSRFIRGAVEDMPIQLQIPVFILCVAMLLLVVCIFYCLLAKSLAIHYLHLKIHFICNAFIANIVA